VTPEAQADAAPPRRTAHNKSLLRAQAQDLEEYKAATVPLQGNPNLWAGVGDSVSNFVIGSTKGATQTYTASALLGNKVQ